MPSDHSRFNASGFEQVMLCPGSHVLQAGLPRSTSRYAAEGTAAHQVLTWALQESRPAAAFIGRVIEADGFTFNVDDDMAGFVQVCLDYVYDVAGEVGEIIVDRRVCYARYLELPEDEGWGTLDVAVLLPDELVVIDFKYGMGVEVQAGQDTRPGPDFKDPYVPKPNPQLALYGLGALVEYGDLADFGRVRLAISQPRITSKPSEYDLTVPELEAWGRSDGRSAVATALNAHANSPETGVAVEEWNALFLRAGDKQCRFCKAAATCPALRDDALDALGVKGAGPEEFGDALDVQVSSPAAKASLQVADAVWLSAVHAKADLIETWLAAVRGEVERRLLAAEEVPGFKLVMGKQGNRAWSDKAEAEAALKAMRLPVDLLYDRTVISPTSAEKLAPKYDKDGRLKPSQEPTPIGDRQWKKLQRLITRAPAKKSVAPVSDPRPAIAVTPVVEDFDAVTATPEDASELA